MRLAAENIVVTIGSERITLRPTLVRALRLERHYEGLDNLVAKLLDGNLQAVAHVLADNANSYTDGVDFLAHLEHPAGIYTSVEFLIPALVDHVFMLAGVDITATQNKPAKSRRAPSRQSFADELEHLFKIATGWLHWSPATAWDSTPAEILAAQAGFIELWNAQNGKAPEKPDHRTLDDKFADVFLKLSTNASPA